MNDIGAIDLGVLDQASDLVIVARRQPEISTWFGPWATLFPHEVAAAERTILFASRFGTLFFLLPDGRCQMLDVFFGELLDAAPDLATLVEFAADLAWQETYLLAGTVRALAAAGIVAQGSECYAIAPHPAAGGPDPWAEAELDPAAIMVIEGAAWQGLCVTLLRQARAGRAGGE
ncbi:MAG: hypothetical protein ABI639_06705 [Thermoanaerobaculia bacterium]